MGKSWEAVPFVHYIDIPGESPHKGQWRGALMFSLICARINGWVNNRENGSLRRHRTHYDVIVMMCLLVVLCWLTQIITDEIETVVGKQIWQTSDFLAFVNWRNIICRYMQIGDISKWVKMCIFEMCLTKLIYSCWYTRCKSKSFDTLIYDTRIWIYKV